MEEIGDAVPGDGSEERVGELGTTGMFRTNIRTWYGKKVKNAITQITSGKIEAISGNFLSWESC